MAHKPAARDIIGLARCSASSCIFYIHSGACAPCLPNAHPLATVSASMSGKDMNTNI
jgi:hypothetical protein